MPIKSDNHLKLVEYEPHPLSTSPYKIRRGGTQFLDFRPKILEYIIFLDEIFIFAFPSPF